MSRKSNWILHIQIYFEYKEKTEKFFLNSIIWKAILSRRSFHEYQLRVLKNMQFAGACVTHVHLPEENFLFELTVKRDAYATCTCEWFPVIAGRSRDPFVEYLRYPRGEGQIVSMRKMQNKVRHKSARFGYASMNTMFYRYFLFHCQRFLYSSL